MEKPANILIVDDNVVNRNVLKALVTELGHTPFLAENGSAALSALEKQLPDLVLLDILMPDISGYDVLHTIRKNNDLRNIPVIMVSAVDEIESVVRCIENGADDYLVKPFNRSILKARIGACLEKKLLRDTEQALHQELKKNYDALREAELARDAITHMVVHDLRNSVQAILGYTELTQFNINSDTIDTDSINKDLTIICNAIEEMLSLISSLLDVSKLEAGELPVSYGKIDTLDLMKEISERYAPLAKQKNVRIFIDSESDAVTVSADRGLLMRVLQNLITNALRYTHTKIRLSLKKYDKDVVMSIEDDGPGISEEYRTKIFNKFFQIAPESGEKKQGVGLGLAFCKMAVEAQNGRIWVEDNAGKGALFRIAFEKT